MLMLLQISLQCSGGVSGEMGTHVRRASHRRHLELKGRVGKIVILAFGKSMKVSELPCRLCWGGHRGLTVLAARGRVQVDAVFTAGYSRVGTSGCCVHYRLLKGGYKWMLSSAHATQWGLQVDAVFSTGYSRAGTSGCCGPTTTPCGSPLAPVAC